ncbi:MAG: OmpA family protein [Deltaproteobacteria bacterium]|nr:OmpA family protein [Deltaproteobacteria bacterium]
MKKKIGRTMHKPPIPAGVVGFSIIFLIVLQFALPVRASSPAPPAQDVFTFSGQSTSQTEPVLDRQEYQVIVDSKTISHSLSGEKGSIDLCLEFSSGSATLTTSAELQITEIAGALHSPKLSRSKILITGHTDNIGPARANLELSRKRAAAVKQALVELGIEENRMQTLGRGEEEPLADNREAVGRARNRRVTLSLQP